MTNAAKTKSAEPQAQHTPGPWWLGEPDEYYEGHTPIDSKLHGGLAQVVTKMDGEDNPKVEAKLLANARLIAAAPDLLVVAEKVKAWNAKYPSSRIFSHSEIIRIAAEMDAINAEANAAIAKATGRAA